jgi:hypothetical protein
MDKRIDESLAKELLRALYGLDSKLNRLDSLVSSLGDSDLKRSFQEVLGELMGDITCDLMVPIYAEHGQLGRASEPGSWLTDDT